MDNLLEWSTKNPGLAAALIALFGAILATILNILLWPAVKSGLALVWDFVRTQLSGRHFENKYLDWMIGEHRYLPVLPTTLVPVTEGHHQELDRLYVALSVSNTASTG